MPDITLSYASEDVETATKLYELLSPLWDVAWDDPVVGSYVKWAETTIPASRCLVVLLSPVSREKDTVRDEMRIARQKHVARIPVIIETCEIPYPEGENMRVDLREWTGDPQAGGYLQLLRKLGTIVRPRRKPPRLTEMLGGRLHLPCLFQSISSYETRLKPLDALTVASYVPKPILMSAYDTRPVEVSADTNEDQWREAERRSGDRLKLLKLMEDYRAKGGIILLDSGGYEVGRLKNRDWGQESLWASWAETPHDLAFCFDDPNCPIAASHPPSKLIEMVVRTVEEDSKHASEGGTVLPIVHMARAAEGELQEYHHDLAPEVMRGVAERLQPPLIAIPERELGNGICERAKTMRAIRESLSGLSFYQPVHILGTGAPWTIAVLAAAGADSFDGLEWCRYVVDRRRKTLQHFHHLDFFSFQSLRDGDPDGLEPHDAIATAAIQDDKLPYRAKVAAHNLAFYEDFLNMLRFRAKTGNFAAALIETVPSEYKSKLEKDIPELFA